MENKNHKSEINKKIALMLGFEIFDPGEKSGSPIQWIYPEDWIDARYSIPTTEVPDFLRMINDRRKTIEDAGGIIPKDLTTNMNGHINVSLYPKDNNKT